MAVLRLMLHVATIIALCEINCHGQVLLGTASDVNMLELEDSTSTSSLAGRRGRRFLSTQGSFVLSSGSNRAGNDEEEMLGEESESQVVAGGIPSGYIDLVGTVAAWLLSQPEGNWLEQLTTKVRDFQMIPMVGIGQVAGMSTLTFTKQGVAVGAAASGGSLQNMTVSGTLNGTSCEMYVDVGGMMCPPKELGFTQATCTACTKGFVNIEVYSGLITNPKEHQICARWFTRADNLARIAVSMLQTSSQGMRIKECAPFVV